MPLNITHACPRVSATLALIGGVVDPLVIPISDSTTISVADLSGFISAIANVVMAGGVIFAAKSLRVQKHVHLVDLHNRFQATIREIQQRMPHDINERITFTAEEKRVIRLYWYAVFDEWFTCRKRSKDKSLNQLWSSFIWGARSAIEHIPLFASEFVNLRKGKPYLLGTQDEFFTEVESFCRSKAAETAAPPTCVFLFGAPCCGKTSIAEALSGQGWRHIAIDEIIRQLEDAPTFDSFVQHAESICLHIFSKILKTEPDERHAPIVIELGCLFPKESSYHLRDMLRLISIEARFIKVEASEELSAERAWDRNLRVRAGTSHALVIDDIEKIPTFFEMLNRNLPDGSHAITTTDKTPSECADLITAAIRQPVMG